MQPPLIDQMCGNCGRSPSRDWSSVLKDAIRCDLCAIHKYKDDPDWLYPQIVGDTQIEPGVYVRTQALRNRSKYGWHWHCVAIDTRTSRMKEVRRYYDLESATDQHQACVNFVLARREEMKRVRALAQSQSSQQRR